MSRENFIFLIFYKTRNRVLCFLFSNKRETIKIVFKNTFIIYSC